MSPITVLSAHLASVSPEQAARESRSCFHHHKRDDQSHRRYRHVRRYSTRRADQRDEHGKRLAGEKFSADASGYRAIVEFIVRHGAVIAVGVEGTGSYGAELARTLTGEGFHVVEVNRPNRQARRLRGKSDPLDPTRPPSLCWLEHGTSIPKARDGYVEALRVLRTARTSAVRARTAVQVQINSVLVTAPEPIRATYRTLRPIALIKAQARTRPFGDAAEPAIATAITLKGPAKRHQYLSAEIDECDTELARLVRQNAPALLAVTGVGNAVASQLLVTISDNPDRSTSEAQFAALTGVAPIPASSGKTIRHRLSRAANAAIHRIALVRMSKDPRTKEYVARRTSEGKSRREIMRCLKRYIAREIFRALHNPRPIPRTDDLRPRRLAQNITLTKAARPLGLWPSGIARIGQGKNRDHELTNRYRDWLNKQVVSVA